MPKTRLEVARGVHAAFREAENAAEHSSATIGRCAATLVEARGKAHLPPAVGSGIFSLMARSSSSAFDARHAIVAAHPLLDDLARNLGLVGVGPDKELVPNSPFVGARSPMRVVSEAA
ncbi:hypothetical protein C8J46_10912 [Sphingomonas sp. PP-F2F-A104-K0414]|uniref:hypothetical protein n=1 Tax=Sphingomonas sp. PP-F2F-A104-K0414 TaxID=2135661 RepID=UPI001044FD0F|nr:hypothetical protein [Sphingomonas sp. PP-F2F-A104-K0414]TCP96318.1 hypothetical protein C8J46_10912 [Sphingomonas sp. PP-F2F-A104-K0414]